MPTYQEYEDILYGEADSALSRPVGTRRDIQAAVAEARRRVVRKKNELTQGITKAWKEGFARLKAENDQMQKDLLKAHKMVDQMTSERSGDMIEGIQK